MLVNSADGGKFRMILITCCRSAKPDECGDTVPVSARVEAAWAPDCSCSTIFSERDRLADFGVVFDFRFEREDIVGRVWRRVPDFTLDHHREQ